MLLGQAEPRVEQVARTEARVFNGNARKEKVRALLLLPLADLALAGGFLQTKDKLEALMETPLSEKQTRLLGELVTAIVQDAQQRQPGLDNVVSGEINIEEWLNSI